MQIRYRRALMCPPAYFTVRDVKNPFMDVGNAVDPLRAREQWSALREAFAAAGVAVETIDAVDDLEDMVFAANQTFVGWVPDGERFAVPSRMRYASREREVPHYRAWMEAYGIPILELHLDAASGEFLEGHGDLLQDPGGAHVWAGYGFRSSERGVARFAEAMAAKGIGVTPLRLTDPTFYHLDTCFAPLSDEAALVYEPAFSADALAALRRGWKRLHAVDASDAHRFACNGVAVNGRFLVAHLSDPLAATLRSEGLDPLVVDTSEFEKAGGSVFCLKTFLE